MITCTIALGFYIPSRCHVPELVQAFDNITPCWHEWLRAVCLACGTVNKTSVHGIHRLPCTPLYISRVTWPAHSMARVSHVVLLILKRLTCNYFVFWHFVFCWLGLEGHFRPTLIFIPQPESVLGPHLKNHNFIGPRYINPKIYA